MSLEDQIKTIPGLQKLIEQYKQEKLDMENARFEEFTASKVITIAAHLCLPYFAVSISKPCCALLGYAVEGRRDS